MSLQTKTAMILGVSATIAAAAIALTPSAESAPAATDDKVKPVVKTPPGPTLSPYRDVIQIALLLDTSSSMSGLIDQARTQVWRIANRLAETERNGHRPRLQIALYEYGKDTLDLETGYIRQVLPFTDDLDSVSEQLFALTTNGGDEHAGQVIERAMLDLEWSSSDDALKVVFIAGNEGFDQGPTSYADAMKAATAKGVVVNTIYCGSETDPVRRGWAHGAKLAGGMTLNIDHNEVVAHIDSPHDAELVRLGTELNRTYLAYGAHGASGAYRQAAQDANVSGSGSAVHRSISKSLSIYGNARWDLVDAVADGMRVDDLDAGDLPEAMRKMTKDERRAFVAKMKAERAAVQARIKELSRERDEFVATKRKEMSADGTSSLDEAMIQIIGDQAGAKGFDLE